MIKARYYSVFDRFSALVQTVCIKKKDGITSIVKRPNKMSFIKESIINVRAWDRSIRVFHWVNFMCFLLLVAGGTAIHFTPELGLSLKGNVLLKQIHTWIGYVFIVNLCWRIILGFIGSYHTRWRQIMPFKQGYGKELITYIRAFFSNRAIHYAGHNPLGRISVFVILIVSSIQGISGLSLAGTDIYMPPFGGMIAEYIAAPGVNPEQVKPHVPGVMPQALKEEMLATVDPESFAAMRAVRAPIVTLHIWGYYFLIFLAALHITAVVLTEIKGQGNIISAMFTGRKSFKDMPVDLPGAAKSRHATPKTVARLITTETPR